MKMDMFFPENKSNGSELRKKADENISHSNTEKQSNLKPPDLGRVAEGSFKKKMDHLFPLEGDQLSDSDTSQKRLFNPMDEQDTFLEKMDMYLLGGEELPSISKDGPDA